MTRKTGIRLAKTEDMGDRQAGSGLEGRVSKGEG
jgi:hypothetical protein